MEAKNSLGLVPDDELLRRLAELLCQSRRVEADLVGHIGEVDARRLYAREASPSMFAYCTEVLHLSEAEAYLRIAAARASREHPMLLTMLADGRIHLTAMAKLAPHLTRENRDVLLKRAAHKTRRQIEELIAELAPRPDAPAVMRKLPERQTVSAPVQALRDGSGQAASATLERPGGAEPPEGELRLDGVATPPARVPAPPATIQPLSPTHYRIQFTVGAELRDKLERLKALMRSSVPDGDLAAIIEQAVTEKLERLEARRFAKTSAPRKGLADSDTSPSSRHLPAAVRRAVHERDEGRCRFVDEQGRRCTARDRLEFHHRHPFAHGGDHSLEGVALLCRTHNHYLAEVDYGREAMAGHRRSRARVSEPAAASLLSVPARE